MKRNTHFLILFAMALGGFLFAQRPTHLNIFHNDSTGKEHVVSLPMDEISGISFLAYTDSLPVDTILPGDSILPGGSILPDSVPTLPILPDTIPADTLMKLRRSVQQDSIATDTIPLEPIPSDTIIADTDTLPQSSEIGKKRFEAIRLTFTNDSYSIIYPDSTYRFLFGTNVPLIRIFTDSIVSEISSKEEYLHGVLNLSGYGYYPDLDSVAVNIRGRGNSTWLEPKKPYRLKFDKKQALCDMTSAKSFVLIANYIDPTLSRNAMAFRLAQLFEMPFTNHSIPVNVELNGIPKGAYMLSEKIGIGKGSVNIDENTGILWELDTNFDEEYQFMSYWYDLPVMLSDPDPLDILPIPEEVPEESDPSDSSDNSDVSDPSDSSDSSYSSDPSDPSDPKQWFAEWQKDYEKMEESVFNGYPEETIDLEQLAKFLLVNLVCGNHEVSWPKSVKLYKEDKDSLYKFGPVWDFDWGFGYAFPVDRLLFTTEYYLKGSILFIDIIKTNQFMDCFGKIWEQFKTDIYPQWMDYLNEYTSTVKISGMQDEDLWPDGAVTCEMDYNREVMRQWIEQRVNLIDAHPHYLLY